MTKLYTITTILLCTLIFNCDAIDELTMFNIENETGYTIPSTTLINSPLSLNTGDVETESETTFSNNNTNKDLIESIMLKSIVLSIKNPENATFNFLKDIRIYINSDNQEEIEIAHLLSIENTNANTLMLNTLGKELEAYVKADSYKLRIETTTDETVAQQTDISIKNIFEVDAKILGL